jgi:hypothetical protein
LFRYNIGTTFCCFSIINSIYSYLICFNI